MSKKKLTIFKYTFASMVLILKSSNMCDTCIKKLLLSIGSKNENVLLCGVRNFTRFCIHEFLDFFYIDYVRCLYPQIRVMIGKNDINVLY